MKRKLYFLTLLMCILGGFNLSNLNAQTTVTIGDETNATTNAAISLTTIIGSTLVH